MYLGGHFFFQWMSYLANYIPHWMLHRNLEQTGNKNLTCIQRKQFPYKERDDERNLSNPVLGSGIQQAG